MALTAETKISGNSKHEKVSTLQQSVFENIRSP